MANDSPLHPGDTMVTVQISPCVGGLVRTWTDDGGSRLWSTPDAEWLLNTQATGQISRTLREDRRFREVGLLAENTSTLMIPARFPVSSDEESYQIGANPVSLEPETTPSESVLDDFRDLLMRAIQQCVTHSEFLVVERGGWDASIEPFCLFILLPADGGPVSVVETAPDPRGSEIWEPHIVVGRESQSLRAR